MTLKHEAAYINGRWQSTNNTIAVDNPATQEVIGRVPNLDESHIQQATDHAHTAWQHWRELPTTERGDYLMAWYHAIMAHQDELAALMTEEQGKPLAEAKGEIAYGASFVKWFAEEARRANGNTIPAMSRTQQITVIKQPVGVCAAITPWNFPNSMITRKAAAALAAGCTIIVKPASATPFSALALAQLAEDVGIPKGVFNVVTGKASMIAKVVTTDARVRKISFTGSTDVGRQLMQSAATNIQRISLELGGNAPFIVFDDADIDKAVAGAVAAKFRNNGQTCVCVNRFYVHRSVLSSFESKLVAAVKALQVGNGIESGVQLGPLINNEAVQTYQQHIDDALEHGGNLLYGNQAADGNFVQPTVITNVSPKARVCREETFAPLAAIVPFDSETEVLDYANESEYGLAGYFYSESVRRCWRVAMALEVGMVGINEGLISNATAPFGGIKASGLGREGAHDGLEEYLETKYLCFNFAD
ncbi:NAD-dependent succinate-semialdehyde dehydrogenase [Salinibius halmophilus]|uniref:NAD-dependent succinate-semialdehyde dehydrogenase n=1 Tax=Salinibius halmophilus TaxID=1853216 RepID=UPI000E668611|nr:NAD-dependent succinate-semialdehyde dehydrogenase [Salinibius halmophilus]